MPGDPNAMAGGDPNMGADPNAMGAPPADPMAMQGAIDQAVSALQPFTQSGANPLGADPNAGIPPVDGQAMGQADQSMGGAPMMEAAMEYRKWKKSQGLGTSLNEKEIAMIQKTVMRENEWMDARDRMTNDENLVKRDKLMKSLRDLMCSSMKLNQGALAFELLHKWVSEGNIGEEDDFIRYVWNQCGGVMPNMINKGKIKSMLTKLQHMRAWGPIGDTSINESKKSGSKYAELQERIAKNRERANRLQEQSSFAVDTLDDLAGPHIKKANGFIAGDGNSTGKDAAAAGPSLIENVPSPSQLANGYSSGKASGETKAAKTWPTKATGKEAGGALQGAGATQSRVKEATKTVTDAYVDRYLHDPKLSFDAIRESMAKGLLG
jgi:hypothetical protein